MEQVEYRIPKGRYRVEHVVMRSRFIATAGYTPSLDDARSFIQQLRSEMPDASHHVYGFRVGYGRSVIEGMSDDGEPSGTAGPPVLAVVRGSEIGDLTVVVTRYFGGALLGTGGLVRAYTEAAQMVIAELPTTLNTPMVTFGIALPYSLHDAAVRLINSHKGVIIDKDFGSEVTLIISMPQSRFEDFSQRLKDLSKGSVSPTSID